VHYCGDAEQQATSYTVKHDVVTSMHKCERSVATATAATAATATDLRGLKGKEGNAL
jgi:hypothetical protein